MQEPVFLQVEQHVQEPVFLQVEHVQEPVFLQVEQQKIVNQPKVYKVGNIIPYEQKLDHAVILIKTSNVL